MQSRVEKGVVALAGVSVTVGVGLLTAYFTDESGQRERALAEASVYLIAGAFFLVIMYYVVWPLLTALSNLRAGWMQSLRVKRASQQRQGLEIIEAVYGEQPVWENVTTLVRGYVVNNRLDIEVTNETMGGDPVVNRLKQLHIKYARDGVEDTRAFNEGTRAVLPPA